ncbi:MAG: SAM-dependent methyltransferase, partial [Patescibacteria group bacterium]
MGTLFIVSTPIGNLEDITFRAVKTLLAVDVILCEDTRRTGRLLHELKQRFLLATGTSAISEPGLISYYDQIESQRLPEIIQLLEANKNVALVSDSGTPLISDPGYKLVREARKRQIAVKVIPGATAAIAALSVSGFPT